MTYGWAILIIVIVAGVLYSFGIFNPSSSASATITGFSGLGSVQAECIGSQGMSMRLGNSVGQTIQIENVSVTSNGNKAVSYPQQTLSPDSAAVLYIPNVCPSSGSRYSLTVTVYYSEPGSVFSGPYSSTGTISGQAVHQQLSSSQPVITSVPITITNSQNTSTPSPFQQIVVIPSQVYGGYAASNFQNVEFFYPNGTIIPSWLENYTKDNATYWLKLSSIPALSSATVYMGFVSTSTNLFNTNDIGEAPQLSPTYAEYDNGANVFNDYWNFAGTSLPSGWVVQSGGTASVNNGLTLSSNGQNYGVYSTSTDISSGDVIDALMSLENSNAEQWIGGESTFGFAGGFPGGLSVSGWGIGTSSSGSITGWPATSTTSPASSNVPFIITGYYISGGMEFLVNYNTVNLKYSGTCGSDSIAIAGYGSAAVTSFTQWARIRAYPPSGVMPSVSFGPPSQITEPSNVQYFAPVTISNNQNTLVSNFQQMVNVPSSVFSGYANTASGTAFQNVEFFYANGTIIPSWLENYTPSNARYWIKLPSVPTTTSFTVYIGFAATSTNLFNNVNVGVAPQLSSTYGQYDDGANVFNFYDNFAGTTLSSKWTVVSGTAGTDYTVNNGFTLLTTNTRIQSSSFTVGSNQVLYTEVYSPDSVMQNGWDFGVYSSSSSAYGWHLNDGGMWYYNDGYSMVSSTPLSAGYTYLTFSNAGSSDIILNLVNPAYTFNEQITNSVAAPITFGERFDNGDAGQAQDAVIYFVYVRAYPPSGVMPSVTFGSVQ